MNSTLLFSRFGNQKTLESFCKGRRRRGSSRRCSKRFKGCKRICVKVVCKGCKCYSNANQGLAFIDSSCLVKKTIRRVITFRKTWKILDELHLLIFIQNLSLVIDYQNHVIDYTKLFMKGYDSSQLILNSNVQMHW